MKGLAMGLSALLLFPGFASATDDQLLGRLILKSGFTVPAAGSAVRVDAELPSELGLPAGWSIVGQARREGSPAVVSIEWSSVQDAAGRQFRLASPARSRLRTEATSIAAGQALSAMGSRSAVRAAAEPAAPGGSEVWTDLGCDPADGTVRRRLVQLEAGNVRAVADCRPGGDHPVYSAVGCPPVLDLKAGSAAETSRVLDASTGAPIGLCATNAGNARALQLEKVTTGCRLLHDWEEGRTYGEVALSVRYPDRSVAPVRRCAPERNPSGGWVPAFAHVVQPCAALALPSAAATVARRQSIEQTETVVRAPDLVAIRVCQPSEQNAGSWRLASESCPGQFVSDRRGGWTYGTHRWFVTALGEGGRDVGPRIAVTGCLQNEKQRFQHLLQATGWTHDDRLRSSTRLGRLVVDLPSGVQELQAAAPIPGVTAPYQLVERAAVPAGAPEKLGCEGWQRHAWRARFRRADASEVVLADGPAPARRIAACR